MRIRITKPMRKIAETLNRFIQADVVDWSTCIQVARLCDNDPRGAIEAAPIADDVKACAEVQSKNRVALTIVTTPAKACAVLALLKGE